MGYLENIIKDARRTSPSGVLSGPVMVLPEADTPSMDGDASTAAEMRRVERVDPGAAAAPLVAAPDSSGGGAFGRHPLAVTPLYTAPSPPNGGVTPVPAQPAWQAGDRGYPPAGGRPSPPLPVDTGIDVGTAVQSQVENVPPVPERPAAAAGDGVARVGMTIRAPSPSFPAGCAPPCEPGLLGPARTAGTQAVEPPTSEPLLAQNCARARPAPAGTVVSPHAVAAGALESASAGERQATAPREPPPLIPGKPEPGVPLSHSPTDRGAPNGVEARFWPREHAAEQSRVIESRVHIGRIDIIVQVPDSPREAPSPATTPSDMTSRLYLRRL